MKNATDITVILDRSGSMTTIQKDMKGGFDTFIQKQRESNVDDVTVSLVKFDNVVEIDYIGWPLHRVPKLDLQPRHSTALYDAIGLTQEELEALKAKKAALTATP